MDDYYEQLIRALNRESKIVRDQFHGVVMLDAAWAIVELRDEVKKLKDNSRVSSPQ
jgi:hypothetical protein